MSDLAAGILCGLLAALMQSCSYLGGRRFLAREGNAVQLMISSLIICGISAWLLAPFYWMPEKFFTWQMALWVLLADGGFVLGQWGFFNAQKHIESSRIASLLGLKVLAVTLLTMTFLGERYTIGQYGAIAGAAAAAMLMNWNKGKLDWKGMNYLLTALLGYATSDLGIQQVVKLIGGNDPITRGMAGFTLTYGILLIGSLAAMPLFKVSWKMVKGALPQGVCWIFSMWGLYVCFGLLGAAFGNVIQASRGVISLVLGIILSYFCIEGLEQKQSLTVWLRKTAAALLMFGAIVLYALSAKG